MPDRLRLTLLAIALASLPWRAAAGQGVAEARMQAERFLQEYQAEQLLVERANRENLEQRQSDTIAVGGLRLVAGHLDRPVVEAAASAAWPRIERRYGHSSSAMARYPIWIERVDSAGTAFSASARFPDGSNTNQNVGAGVGAISAGLLRYADLLLWGNADSALSAWYPSTPDPGFDSIVAAERVYLELVTSLSVKARSCLVGDDQGCIQALGLREIHDPLINSYDPAGRRALAARIEQLLTERVSVAQYRDCVDGGEDAACLEALRTAMIPSDSFGRYRLPPPVGDAPRRALVAQMERLGGAEAWSRLIGSPGRPLEERFAIAAGVPPDSLIRAWRRAVVAARPIPASVTPSAFLMALLWGGLGLVYAMRYSRWH